jgi:hypothetical protein
MTSRWLKFAVAASLLLGSAVAAVSTNPAPAKADSGAASVLIDLANPSADIHDPAGALPPLARDCASGQVDVNSASESDIGAATGITSQPTLDRIVAGRPWLRSVDLVSVPGVGPSRTTTLNSALCATPTTLPPAVTHAPPAGFTGIDLQVATAQQIADAGLLPLPVAQRLKSYGPLPDDLHQVATPAIPGLSDPTIDKLLSSGKAAITPYPFVFSGTSWRWASHDHGAVVAMPSDPRYSLFVPTGRVDGNGAWATVTPKAPEEDVLPKAGFHIYGSWTPEVAMQLPNLDGQSAAGETIFHDASDGPHMSTGTGIADGVTPGSVVVAVSSLSDGLVALGEDRCLDLPDGYLAPTSQVWCIQNLRDTPLATAFKSTLAFQAHFAGTTPGECPLPSNPLFTVHGHMHSMRCTHAKTSGTTGTATWRNDSGDGLHFGNVYEYQKSPSNLSLDINRNPDKGWFTTEIFDGMADDWDVIPPGDGFDVTVQQGDAPATTQVRTSTRAILFWMASQVTSLLDVLSARAINKDELVGCALQLANKADFKSYLGCAGKVVANIAKLVKATAKNLSTKDRERLGTIAKKAGELAAITTLVDFELSDLQWGAEDDWDKVTYVFRSPLAVFGVSPGDGSPMHDGRYIARVGRAAYLVFPASNGQPPVAEPIKTGDDFNCYATGYFVVDNVTKFEDNDNAHRLNLPGLPVADDFSSHGAIGCDSLPRTWDYTPKPTGNVPFGIIIKMPDWEGSGSWWITPDGTIESITDQGVYQCLAAKAPVIFNFPFDKVQAWRPVADHVDASCP